MRISILGISVIMLLSCCGQGDNTRYFEKDHARWQETRIERLKSKTGWLNLAGLYWLEEGENTLGSDSSNSIIFPDKAPAFIGKYILKNGHVSFMPHPDTDIKSGDNPATVMDVLSDKSGTPTLLETGSFAWFIIERSPMFGIRLRDYEHHSLKDFHGIESFPTDEDWVIKAEFEPFEEPRELLIPTVIGTVEKNECPGILRFNIGDTEQVLYPSGAGEGLFIIFADESSGLETYGGGRFLYIDKPGDDNKVSIDFNRAYNPPCAFTPFATCPLPPRENFLSVGVEAGEKFAGH